VQKQRDEAKLIGIFVYLLQFLGAETQRDEAKLIGIFVYLLQFLGAETERRGEANRHICVPFAAQTNSSRHRVFPRLRDSVPARRGVQSDHALSKGANPKITLRHK